jgi:hypothetical protein
VETDLGSDLAAKQFKVPCLTVVKRKIHLLNNFAAFQIPTSAKLSTAASSTLHLRHAAGSSSAVLQVRLVF